LDFFLLTILGKKGIILAIGIIIFTFVYRHSEELFEWIEDKTFGTRDFILTQSELLFWKIDPQKVTWGLLTFCIGGSLVTFIGLSILFSFWVGTLFSLFFFFLGWQIPKPIMSSFVDRRRMKFLAQMVDGLNLISSGLRAGLSLPQAMGMVVDELPNPIAQEFNLVLQQNRLGVSLDEALENLNTRIKRDDIQMFVTSVTILRETGGNLPETFDTIAEVLRERVRLEQKIATFVAQGKTQGIILCAMPFVLLLMFTVSDPKTMEGLFKKPIGLIMLFAAMGLVFLGGFVMSKIIKIKV
jgi:tight adherence protein B